MAGLPIRVGAGPRRPLSSPLLPHSSTLLHLAVKLAPFTPTSQCLGAQLRLCNSAQFCCSCELVRLLVVDRLGAREGFSDRQGQGQKPPAPLRARFRAAGVTECHSVLDDVLEAPVADAARAITEICRPADQRCRRHRIESFSRKWPHGTIAEELT